MFISVAVDDGRRVFGAHVSREVSRLSECARAERAVVRTIAGMDPDVTDQSRSVRERRQAGRTDERTSRANTRCHRRGRRTSTSRHTDTLASPMTTCGRDDVS